MVRTPSTLAVVAGLCLALLASPWARSLADEPKAPKSFYLIGNSLTWDTVPPRLAGDVQWHVDCGVSLPYIFANPGKPCVKESTLWPQALAAKPYDVISVQPHDGSTLAQDVETISAWMKLQPRAVFVLHSGWARHARRADEFAGYSAPNTLTHGPIYFRALVAELRRLHPGREIRLTLAQNLLAQIADDIAAKRAPIDDVAQLYRDDIHMTHETGKYLMHNAMRRALGQPRSTAGFEKIEPRMRQYFDQLLDWLETSPADRAIMTQLLAIDGPADRAALVGKIGSVPLREKLTELLPRIGPALDARRANLQREAEVREAGGKVIWAPAGPQWLYLATGDEGVELFDVPVAVDLYNGGNPLKGRGGRNDRVDDRWLEKLAGLTTLKRLDLANCNVQGDGLRHLAGIAGLRELNLTLTPVADDGLRHLSGLKELRTLGLASTQCTGRGFEHLTALQKLENVNFHFTPLDDAGLRAVSRLPISDRLWFAHTKFTDAGAASLRSLVKLRRCGIGGTDKASTGEAVAALVDLPLEELSLLDNQAVPVGVAHAARIATLRLLDLSHAPTVGDDSLKQLAAAPRLEELRIGGAQVTDAGLLTLAESKSLKRLVLSGLSKTTPAGVERLRAARPMLTIESR